MELSYLLTTYARHRASPVPGKHLPGSQQALLWPRALGRLKPSPNGFYGTHTLCVCASFVFIEIEMDRLQLTCIYLPEPPAVLVSAAQLPQSAKQIVCE
ncbi:unnamed protein product [Leuciscus chuanchicus]